MNNPIGFRADGLVVKGSQFEQSGWKTEVFKAKDHSPEDSLKSKAVRAIAGVITLGISEMLKKTAGYFLANSAVMFGYMDKDSRQKYFEYFEKNHPNSQTFSSKLEVHTADDVKLEGMLIAPQREPSKKYVILLNGLGHSYETNLDEAVKYANTAEANILVFNYRGTDDFKNAATSTKDFVTDTMSMVEYLKSKGIQSEDIVIHGFSMGGGIGAQAAALTGTRHINDRSFTAFSKAIKFFISDILKDKIGDTAAKFIGSATAQLMKKLDFEMDTRKVMQIDAENANPQIASIRDRTLIIYNKEDEKIKEHFSLHTFVKKTPSTSISPNYVQLKREDFLDIQKFKELTSKNSDLLKHVPIATYQQYADAGYTPQQYVDMLRMEIPGKIEELSNPRNQKIKSLEKVLIELKERNPNPSATKDVVIEQIRVLKNPLNPTKLSNNIAALEKTLDDLNKLDPNPTKAKTEIVKRIDKLKEEKAASLLAAKIRALDDLLADLAQLDLNPLAHESDISTYNMTVTSAIYTFVNDKNLITKKMDFYNLEETNVGDLFK